MVRAAAPHLIRYRQNYEPSGRRLQEFARRTRGRWMLKIAQQKTRLFVERPAEGRWKRPKRLKRALRIIDLHSARFDFLGTRSRDRSFNGRCHRFSGIEGSVRASLFDVVESLCNFLFDVLPLRQLALRLPFRIRGRNRYHFAAYPKFQPVASLDARLSADAGGDGHGILRILDGDRHGDEFTVRLKDTRPSQPFYNAWKPLALELYAPDN
jgi:hypothetical protein